ncbi:MAG: hypothetical protein RMJ56_02430 [Gemmataceae bacterium]|nr:hypothetical protein [Gemmata sp.]MDW8196443.1 hypothetical protein [Gemmataceae bacterium]
MKILTPLGTVAAALVFALFAGANTALAAPKAGNLIVYDEGKLFSDTGIKEAQSKLQAIAFEGGLTVTIDTYPSIPADRKASYNETQKEKFFRDWAVAAATGDKAKGIYVLICREPGYVQVVTDKTTRDRGFTREDEQKLATIFLNGFKKAVEAKKNNAPEAEQFSLRNNALVAAVQFVIEDLKDTKPSAATTSANTTTASGDKTEGALPGAGGSGIAGWLCLGLCVLLGVWLIIGLIRAFTGGGMGPGAAGGGFFSSLLGGLFGAMAGMWLYNNLFGGGSLLGGSEAYAADGTADAGTTGDGDFSGDTGAGGSFDTGGGGGDWGGGGDFGGDF